MIKQSPKPKLNVLAGSPLTMTAEQMRDAQARGQLPEGIYPPIQYVKTGPAIPDDSKWVDVGCEYKGMPD